MKLGLLTLLIAVLAGLSSRAEAGRHYYLVGVRHVYRFDLFPDPRQSARQQIEGDYANAIQRAQNQFDNDMDSIRHEEDQDGGSVHQNDRDAVQENLEKDMADASDAREASLNQIYSQCDWVRERHPELNVDQDGPYRVMGIDTNPYGSYVNVVFYQPWPMYVGPCPYGWGWGHSYAYTSFGVVVTTYHRSWISMGSPFFFGLCIGASPVQFYAPCRREVIINRVAWVGGRPPRITVVERQNLYRMHDMQVRRGAIHIPPARAALFTRPTGVVRNGGSIGQSRFIDHRNVSDGRSVQQRNPSGIRPPNGLGNRNSGGSFGNRSTSGNTSNTDSRRRPNDGTTTSGGSRYNRNTGNGKGSNFGPGSRDNEPNRGTTGGSSGNSGSGSRFNNSNRNTGGSGDNRNASGGNRTSTGGTGNTSRYSNSRGTTGGSNSNTRGTTGSSNSNNRTRSNDSRSRSSKDKKGGN